MKIKICINDNLLSKAKKHSNENNMSLTSLIETALKETVYKRKKYKKKKSFKIVTFIDAGLKSDVNFDNTSALLNQMANNN